MSGVKVAYLVMEMVRSTIPGPGYQHPMVGPTSLENCQQVLEAFKSWPDVATVRCRIVKWFTVCPVPGKAGAFQACPVFEDDDEPKE